MGSLGSRIMKEEIFGPLLPIIVVDNMDEAIHFVNSREKPLALYVFSSDNKVVNKILSTTTSGGACVNDTIFHVSNPHLPFGGVGQSGMGAYHGKNSFDTFSHFRSVMFRSTWLDPSLRYPPYLDSDVKTLKKLVIGPIIPPMVKKLILGGVIVGSAGYLISRL